MMFKYPAINSEGMISNILVFAEISNLISLTFFHLYVMKVLGELSKKIMHIYSL